MSGIKNKVFKGLVYSYRYSSETPWKDGWDKIEKLHFSNQI
jgi:hypothetical protein